MSAFNTAEVGVIITSIAIRTTHWKIASIIFWAAVKPTARPMTRNSNNSSRSLELRLRISIESEILSYSEANSYLVWWIFMSECSAVFLGRRWGCHMGSFSRSGPSGYRISIFNSSKRRYYCLIVHSLAHLTSLRHHWAQCHPRGTTPSSSWSPSSRRRASLTSLSLNSHVTHTHALTCLFDLLLTFSNWSEIWL